MATVTEVLHNFLKNESDKHHSPDMLKRIEPGMECQINVSSAKGEPVEGRRNTYTNGSYKWWNIRIPKNAASTPEPPDYEMTFPLELHAEAIGTTGWNYELRESWWVGFDFDAISGHADGFGVNDAELAEVKKNAMDLDYVEVRRSTSGTGYHLYVSFEDVETSNHTEHAAVARCALSKMGQDSGFDFSQAVDVCGGNMWVWHRKATSENGGLSLVKAASRKLRVADLPANWRDHVDVVSKRRSKVRLQGVSNGDIDDFESLTSANTSVTLTDFHKAVIDALSKTGFSTNWEPDHGLVQTHTCALAKLFNGDNARKELGLSGVFTTNSEGTDPSTPNCFMFPQEDGSWRVFRFGPGTEEHGSWNQDGAGWTWTYFNHRPDLRTASLAVGGVEDTDGVSFHFRTAADAQAALTHLGTSERIPEKFLDRECALKRHRDGRVIARVTIAGREAIPFEWVEKRGKIAERLFDVVAVENSNCRQNGNFDDIFRSLTTPAGSDAGFALKDSNGNWVKHSKDNVRSALSSLDYKKAEADKLLGGAILNNWTLVNLPFKHEYPGKRQWNRDGAQLRFRPSDEPGEHPYWDQVLAHGGRDLDRYLPELDWAQESNILNGRDYLTAWLASMLREPFEPLPYLFFFGPQNSGKSTFHHVCSMLMTKGVVSADRALTDASGFNGELAGAILCYVEEKDLSVAGANAYNRIKDWVNSPMISIRKMRTDSYEQRNTTHWVQCANSQYACPIFPGDTRINVMFVQEPENEIPKKILMEHLESEAPAFMRTLMDFTLPKSYGRLRLPIVNTSHKSRSEKHNMTPVESFILEECYEFVGQKIEFKEFYERFKKWLDVEEHEEWGKTKVRKALPDDIAYGSHTNNVRLTGNLSWVRPPKDYVPTEEFFEVEKGRLQLRSIDKPTPATASEHSADPKTTVAA
ncbi:DUF5906 domain-containing protein [Thalassoroseus pseudoceratinae]|uniref:DUF5906 domain-containing protein n=1 Tax=Thalassoroseus pseudoceratinae TaxID=2713176 RepID=UPI0014203369|nr:DUF5906 domain-containing protein [Thalassoroseus pseudoceratinae]